MLNHMTVMGRLTKDPEIKKTKSGDGVAVFSLAVEREYKDKATGLRPVDFIDFIATGATGTFIQSHFHKGELMLVEGRLQLNDWTDKNGNKQRSANVYTNNVYFCGSKPKSDEVTADEEIPF